MTWLNVLWFYLLLPSLLCDNLLCYYSPILLTGEKPFKLVLTECPPKERCFKAVGRYGKHQALTARGCMAESDCSRRNTIRIKGAAYAMSYACCDRAYCNSCPGLSAKPHFVAAALVAVAVMSGSS